ncbi:MAG: hypothetical protein PUA61_09445, partial [Succinatimonas hippei]|nr:hypothetical protein [Succinatimonas hippei]
GLRRGNQETEILNQPKDKPDLLPLRVVPDQAEFFLACPPVIFGFLPAQNSHYPVFFTFNKPVF